MFSSSYNSTSVDMPAPQRPFEKLASLAQQLRSAGEQLRSYVPPVGRFVQAVSSYASGTQSAPDTGRSLGKFNFGVSMRGVGE